jgi:hypothetical protein
MRKSILLSIPLSIVAATVLASSSHDNEVLSHARQVQLEFRQGNTSVAAPLVKTLEAATAKSPGNAALWEALGHANMSKTATMFTAQPDFPAVLATTQRAREAYARSLALNPDNMLVLSSHGMARMVSAQFAGDAAGIAAGVEEMSEAIRRSPESTGVRLTRAFTTINLPAAMRDNDALIGDLQFILEASTGGRPDDVLHLLLGDVYAEAGKLDAARAEYAQVTGMSAFAAEQVKLRKVDLEKGAITPAHIGFVRENTGSKCVTCHAAGTDN